MTTKNYNQKIETLSFILNNRVNKKSIILFRNTLKDLETDNKTTLSTYFLNGLIRNSNATKKADIIRRVLRRVEVKANFLNSYYKEFDSLGNTIKARKRLKFIIA